MSDGPVYLALRELRTTFTSRSALTAIGMAGLVAGLTGPFNTFDLLGLPLRLIYWLAIAYCSYGVGVVGAIACSGTLLPSQRPQWLAILLEGLGASVPVTLTVVGLNLTFLPPDHAHPSDALWLFPYCLAISTALMAVLRLVIEPSFAHAKTAEPAPEAPPPLLERLPHDVRGTLLHLSMSDHYVEVFTSRGKALVLMRMADAIKETGNVGGLQIHRSHWVAKDAVKAIRRVEGKTVIETKAGALLPVSRSHLPAVRAVLS